MRNATQKSRPPTQLLAIASAVFFSFMLSSTGVVAQNRSDTDQPVRTAPTLWTVELIVFAHPGDNDSWRTAEILDDFRDLPALPAALETINAPAPIIPPALESTRTRPSTNPSQVIRQAWQRLESDYERIGYYRWEQRRGRGAWRRIVDEQALNDDPSISLGPHFQLDGKLQVMVANVGEVDIELQQRTPVTFYDNTEENTIPTTAWRVRKINEQRPIEAGRIEYFDSPGLAALLLVTNPNAEPADSQQ